MDQLPAPVGREVLAAARDGVVDLTVDLTVRAEVPAVWRTVTQEPEDKRLVRLRSDRRDARVGPTFAYLESGAARQLAAALVRAAEIADDLNELPR